MKKVIVTGATGFIGRQVLEILQSRSIYEIHGVRLNTPPLDNSAITWHQVDLLDAKQVDRLISNIRPDFLVHLAWYVVHGQYWDSDKNFFWENASIDLIKKFYENGGKRMVGAGTCAEYQWVRHKLSENASILKPKTIYGKCKLRVGSFLDEYSKKYKLSSVWGRIFFLYGPYEDPFRIVPYVIRSLLKNEFVRCTHGEQIRDFLYVKDVASAFVALLESNIGGVINIGSGKPVALKSIILKIADMLNCPELIKLGAVPALPNDPQILIPDVQKLVEIVKWKPKFDLEMGLKNTIAWWRKTLHV